MPTPTKLIGYDKLHVWAPTYDFTYIQCILVSVKSYVWNVKMVPENTAFIFRNHAVFIIPRAYGKGMQTQLYNYD